MEPAGFSLREPERTSPIEVSSGVGGLAAIARHQASRTTSCEAQKEANHHGLGHVD